MDLPSLRRTPLEYQKPSHSARRIFVKAHLAFCHGIEHVGHANLSQNRRTYPFGMIVDSLHRTTLGEDARRVIHGHVDEDDAGGDNDLVVFTHDFTSKKVIDKKM